MSRRWCHAAALRAAIRERLSRDHLTAHVLAERLGIGVTTAHEALRDLERDGAVERTAERDARGIYWRAVRHDA